MATAAEVAAHLVLSVQALHKLVARDILPAPAGRRQWDLELCRRIYLAYLKGCVAGREGRTGAVEPA